MSNTKDLRKAFEEAIAKDPNDGDQRKVFADYLEENGHTKEAELQRNWTNELQEGSSKKLHSVEDLNGLILSSIEVIKKDQDRIIFTVAYSGRKYELSHMQDCCESVYIEDISGDLDNLIGTPILKAEEKTNHEEKGYDSMTWTFYTFATVKGYVDIRWCGSSNGYYSESVDFGEVK